MFYFEPPNNYLRTFPKEPARPGKVLAKAPSIDGNPCSIEHTEVDRLYLLSCQVVKRERVPPAWLARLG